MNETHRTQWSDTLIESELRSVVSQLGYMPSVSELRSLGRNDLSCAITKRGGVIAWAARIGASRRKSDSDFGWDGERSLSLALESRGFSVSRTGGVKAPYDLLVDGVLRIDVKTAKYAEYGRSTGWFFRVGKTPTCDVVALHRFDVGDTFFIPWMECGSTNITIMNAEGKYAKYREQYGSLRLLAAGLIDAYRVASNVISTAA